MPPLGVQRLESVRQHGPAKDHPVGELLFGDAAPSRALAVVSGIFAGLGVAAEIRMALRAEPVEGPAHVELLLGRHVE